MFQKLPSKYLYTFLLFFTLAAPELPKEASPLGSAAGKISLPIFYLERKTKKFSFYV